MRVVSETSVILDRRDIPANTEGIRGISRFPGSSLRCNIDESTDVKSMQNDEGGLTYGKTSNQRVSTGISE
jgi:hypothetical protein